MPLGSALKSKIDIDFTRAQGVASTGRILFQPPRQAIGTTMVSNKEVPAELINGVATIDLVRLPQGTYRVVEQIDGRPDRSYNFALPLSSAAVVQYEHIVPTQPVPARHQYVSTINGIPPNFTTGDIELESLEGPAGPAGSAGTNGTDGDDGEDGVLKAFATTGMITGTFGPAGDSGAWDHCPESYRPGIAAGVGDKILWTPGFLHKFDQEAICDLASMIDGAPARYRSSGTAVPLTTGYGGLYMHASIGGLRPVWWTVSAEDISSDGKVRLALAFRNNGAGNILGHASVAGDIVVVNAGPGGVL